MGREKHLMRLAVASFLGYVNAPRARWILPTVAGAA
jgi:hypothetical protein